MKWGYSTFIRKFLEPLTTQPAVEELQAGLGLVHGDHVATTVETHVSEVTVRLDLADLLASVLVLLDDDILHLSSGILRLAGPLKSLSPSLVTEPVADEVGVTGIDEDRDLLKKTGHQAVVRLHPIAVEEEVAVDVEVARIIAIDLSAKGLAHTLLVEVLAHVAHALVAKVGLVLTLSANVIDVLASALVRSQQSVVAVDGRRDTDPSALTVVASFNHLLAARQSIVHGLAALLVQNSGVTTLTASHRTVILVLSKAIGQTVSNEHRLQIDVAVLVRKDLRGEDRNIVTSIGLAGNVEVLLGILRELLEEQRQKGIDVLACSHGVADSLAAVGIANVDGLVQKDDGSIRVPRVVVVDSLDFAVDGARTKLHEQTSKRRAARAAVQPQDDRVILGVVARLEEPLTWLESSDVKWRERLLTIKQMLVVFVIIQITTVLLDVRVYAKGAGVDLLDAEVVSFQLSIDLTLLGTIGTRNPHALDLRTADDVVPVRVRTTGVLLGQREHGRVIHGMREVVRDFLPISPSLVRESLQVVLKLLERLGEDVRALLEGVVALLDDVLQLLPVNPHNLLQRRSSRRGRSHQQSGWQNSHDG